MYKLSFIFVLLIFIGCSSSPIDKYKQVDLLKYGMPLKVYAPDSIEIGKDDLGVIQGAWLKGPDYYIQIYSSNASTTDLAKVKQEKKDEVESSIYFSQIIEEDPAGFLYEKDIDGDIRYDFRHIKILGDKEFTFQKGLIGNYSEEAVRNMYAAVKK